MAAEAGTEAADYPNSVSSQALGMDEAAQAVQNAGVTAQWDDETKQNYAKWEEMEVPTGSGWKICSHWKKR